MAINNIGETNFLLKSSNAKGWVNQAELGKISGPKITDTKFPTLTQQDEGQSFMDFLAESISKVNTLQADANVAVEELASGKSKNIHETLIAVEKADLAFKMMNQVRSKVIDAYREVMRMQI